MSRKCYVFNVMVSCGDPVAYASRHPVDRRLVVVGLCLPAILVHLALPCMPSEHTDSEAHSPQSTGTGRMALIWRNLAHDCVCAAQIKNCFELTIYRFVDP